MSTVMDLPPVVRLLLRYCTGKVPRYYTVPGSPRSVRSVHTAVVLWYSGNSQVQTHNAQRFL